MRSALYYPHTHVSNSGLVKTALLLWDRLEYIVPWKHFPTHYSNHDLAEAMELIGRPHCPAPDEQREAHARLEEMISGPLPPQFYLRRDHRRNRSWEEEEPYEMYPEKLLPESWEILRRARVAGHLRDNSDYPLTAYAGLAVMSILADCCAGTTRSRITDRSDAYATIAALLGNRPGVPKLRKAEAHAQLVPISLRVVDASKIDIATLVALRKREEKEAGGKSLRDLRHRYIKGLESYINQLSDVKTTLADVKEIKRQFKTDMERDVQDLKTELGYAATKAVGSGVFIATVLTGVATAASWFGGLHLSFEDVITWSRAPVTIGALVSFRSKYLEERRAAIRKHPMAYLYAAKHTERAKRQRR